LKIIATTGKWLPKAAALTLAASVLTACGGGSAYEEDEPLTGSVQRSAVTVKAGQRATAYGDFNSGIWNEHQWYECDCSRDPSKPLG
jgi:hypothetical protein